MAKLNLAQQLAKPILPFSPTVDANNDPTVCCACGSVALGVGVGLTRPKEDPQYLCKRCIVSVEDLTKMRRLNHYELRALDAGVEAVGEFIEQNGGITDLQHYDQLMQRMLVKAAWEGCARGVREALKEAPF